MTEGKVKKRAGRYALPATIERRRVARELGLTEAAIRKRQQRQVWRERLSAEEQASIPEGLSQREYTAARETVRLRSMVRTRLAVLQDLLRRILVVGKPWWAERLQNEIGRAMADIEREQPTPPKE